ncbi:MAG: hypothetical protein Ct9H300mP25_00440 [Acidobacteriota bacterium]|nr:MAG: hypothetical protein Ct9H300mP25_00440 [Acidobacteriota bacterium]
MPLSGLVVITDGADNAEDGLGESLLPIQAAGCLSLLLVWVAKNSIVIFSLVGLKLPPCAEGRVSRH